MSVLAIVFLPLLGVLVYMITRPKEDFVTA